MPYIGKSPQNGVRNRFVYNATTSSQTAFMGNLSALIVAAKGFY